MDNEKILEGLREILVTIRPSMDSSKISPGSRLMTDVGLDSLTMLLMSLAIENKFGFKFEGMPAFENVGDVMSYIKEHVK